MADVSSPYLSKKNEPNMADLAELKSNQYSRNKDAGRVESGSYSTGDPLLRRAARGRT